MFDFGKRRGYLIVLAAILCGWDGQVVEADDAAAGSGEAAINALGGEGSLRNWVVLGGFPNPEVEEALPDGSFHVGYYQDYLAAVGGEAKAHLTTATSVAFTDEHGQERTAKGRLVKATLCGLVNSKMLDERYEYKVAYAYCQLRSEKEQTVYFQFGGDDGAKVWVNGELVHKMYEERGFNLAEDEFEAELRKGLNSILVKMSNRRWNWVFALAAYDAASFERKKEQFENEQREKKRLGAFQGCEVRPEVKWHFMFEPGKFPELDWENPLLVEKLVGKFELTVRWFDAELNEVAEPNTPGRYGAVIEGTTPKGMHVRRAMTFYCRCEDWRPWENEPTAYMDYLFGSFFPPNFHSTGPVTQIIDVM